MSDPIGQFLDYLGDGLRGIKVGAAIDVELENVDRQLEKPVQRSWPAQTEEIRQGFFVSWWSVSV